jgi:hypothetical protein
MKKSLIAILATIGISVSLLGSSHVFAATSSVAQTYDAAPSVLPGMLVRLDPSASAKSSVIPLTSSSLDKMLGVVIPASGSPIVITPQSSTNQQVVVADSGRYSVLVSDENGPIKTGDQLTISSISGVAMKASRFQSQIIGQSEASFNGYTNVLGTEPLQNSNGRIFKEAIGSIAVNVSLGSNPNYQPTKSILPQFVITTASKIANKQVNTLHIVLAALALVLAAFIAASLLFGGASSRITAIGRNPLAKRSVARALLSVVSFGLMVFVAGLLIAYLIIRL